MNFTKILHTITLTTTIHIIIIAFSLNNHQTHTMKTENTTIQHLDDLRQASLNVVSERFDKKNLLIFDGADGSNQCHINALMIVLLALSNRTFKELKDTEQQFLLTGLPLSDQSSLQID